MGLQMSLVFVCLLTQMVSLVILLVPWPHVVRRNVIAMVDRLVKLPNFRVFVAVETVLLILQFIDCLNRLKRFNNKMQSLLFTSDLLATKFYSQRNLYLSGAVLFLNIALFTVVLIVRKLISKEAEFRKIKASKGPVDEKAEVDKYEQLIAKKQKDIEILKKQIDGLQRAYSQLTPDSTANKKDL